MANPPRRVVAGGRRGGARGSRRVPTLAFMAWRNLWRNPSRSALTVAALAGSLVLLILYLALVGGMTRQMVEHATDLAIGHLQLQRRAFTDDQDLYATLPTAYLAQLERALPGAALAPRLYASALASAEGASNGVLIKAVDPAREGKVTRLLDRMRSGEGALGAATIGPDGLPRHPLLLGAQLARNMKVGAGDEVVLVTQAADASIGNALYRVAGVLAPVDPGFDRSGVLMSVSAFRSLMAMDDGFHELSIRLDDVTRLAEAQAALQQAVATLAVDLPLDDLGGPVTVRTWRQVVPALADMLEVYAGVTWVMGAIVVALAALGMVNTMLMAIHERTYEFGILRAIGMHKGWLLLMVLLESLALALLSVAAGSAVGLALLRGPLRDGIDLSGNLPDGFDFVGVVLDPVLRMEVAPMQVAGACAMTVTLAMLAALLPSWRVLRLKPAEAMR
jgi:putative ABC transport system permease protein